MAFTEATGSATLRADPSMAISGLSGLRSPARSKGAAAASLFEAGWWVTGLAIVAVFGALKLALPAGRDSAVFLWMAEQMNTGARLYADVWDVKQPGIFAFYYGAGKLLGFTPTGIHIVELAWQLCFAALMVAALRSHFEHRWLATVAPVASLCSFYVFCQSHQQAQVEGLVGLPLFVVAWVSAVAWHSGRGRTLGFFAGGLAAAVVTAFKLVLVPIPVAFIAAASLAHLRRREHPRHILGQIWLPFVAGAAVIWAGMTLAFWAAGALEAFFETTFLYPLRAFGEVSHASPARLVLAVAILLASTAPWLIYAGIAAGRVSRAAEPALFGRMGVWLAVGFFMIVLQKSSWWPYHMLLLLPPIGVLAARGIDLVLVYLRGRLGDRVPAQTLSVLFVAPIIAALLYPAGETGRRLLEGFALGGLDGYRRSVSTEYAQASDAAAFLQAHAQPGPIYVFGDPNILLLSRRPQVIREQGSAWAFYGDKHWHDLAERLTATRPVWIFVETKMRPVLEQMSPGTVSLLARDYRVVWDEPYGRWYAATEAGGTAQPLP